MIVPNGRGRGTAGATGSVAGQIARIQGCRTLGVAGSDEKCAWLTGELGFDAAINYKTEEIRQALKDHCPDGIDVYFDNTGGEILSAALFRMNLRGRVVCSGVVSQYDTATPAPGPRGFFHAPRRSESAAAPRGAPVP